MAKLGVERNPGHRPHASGMGRVTIGGRDHYTGKWGTPGAEAEYRRLVMAWNAAGRPAVLAVAGGLTVGGLVAAYVERTSTRYVKRGVPTSYADRVRRVCLALAATRGGTPAAEFGPKMLRAFRYSWIDPSRGGRWRACRGTANGYAKIVVDMFRWAVAEELVGPDVHARLAALDPLDRRDGADGPPPRESAPPDAVAAARAALPSPAREIVELMLVTGMRPSEACSMNVADLDRSGEVWEYRVAAEWNKTEHRGKSRLVFLGPRAGAILEPRLAAAADRGGWLFVPSRCGPGGKRREGPYSAHTLIQVLKQALLRAGSTHFSPNQLRHTALTSIGAALGIAAAKGVAGHSSEKTTLVYLDADVASAGDRAAARAAALALG